MIFWGMAAEGASSLIQPKAESAQEIAPQQKYHNSKPVIDAHFIGIHRSLPT